MTVVLIDDEESFLKLCSKRLSSKISNKIETFSDPEKALEDIDGEVECVVCDYDMPKFNGVDLCEKLMDDYPETSFILYTSYSDNEIVEKAFEAGADDYLKKGIGDCQYRVLANRVKNLIDDSSGEDQSKKKREKFLEEVLSASGEMAEARTIEEIADIAVETMEKGLGMSINGLFIADKNKEKLIPIKLSKEAQEIFKTAPEIDIDNSLAGEVFKDQECMFYHDLEKVEGIYNPDTPIKSEVIIPLGDKGVIMSGSNSKKAFSQTEIHCAELLASVTESSLERAEREQLLRSREEELKKQNQRLNQFASILSHDLRSPLNIAQGYLELAMDTKDEEDLKEVEDAHQRIENIIETMLTLARHTEKAKIQEVSIKELAEQSWKFADPGIGDKLKIQDDFELETDPDKLKHILENLFSNSIEHSDMNVDVRIGSLSDGFYVEDDGPGIPKDKRDEVLEFGYSDEEGTGFGLSIVEQISNLLGFEMEIAESEEGGARFEFRKRKSSGLIND